MEDEAEGVLRTFLIADVRGYTRYTQTRGDEAAAELAARFARLTREVVTAGGGELVELRGDEALAVFTSPRQAVRTAEQIQRRLRGGEDPGEALPLGIGIGIDTGEAVPVEDGWRGKALNVAARLCSLAQPGQ
ncbi:MAG TPA: adenylate/guanylate cyclase domain-containing protein, partial [Gaiellaceae bacterium]|nr:adenylate/guanylate cyclase domain-containing protein [Gaiellaceae bacterium]